MYKIRDDEFELDSNGIVGILDDEDGFFWAIDVYGNGLYRSFIWLMTGMIILIVHFYQQ